MTRFVVIALWVCFLAALPSTAADTPSARLEGYRCEVVRVRDSVTGLPGPTLIVCQIGEDPEPFRKARSPLSDSTRNPHFLAILDNARHDASLQRHDAVVTKPAP